MIKSLISFHVGLPASAKAEFLLSNITTTPAD